MLGAELRLRIPAARSLKDKRAALRPVLDRARARLPVSVAETGDQDDLRFATIGVAVAASSPSRAEAAVDELERLVWSRPDLDVVEVTRRWLDLDE